jgi:hypothetical protein
LIVSLTYVAANTDNIALETSVIDIDMLFHNPVILARSNRGVTCIRNGALLAAGAGLAAIPLDWIARACSFLKGQPDVGV